MTVYAVCGDSGSGKSTLSYRLQSMIPNSMVLECDRYHKWERNHPELKRITSLNPDANNIDMMYHDIMALRSGKSISQVDYDHHTGKFTEKQMLGPAENIIVCGLHLLDNVPYDTKIYLNPTTSLRNEWKISRDTHERGYSKEEVMNSIARRYKDYSLYIEPQMAKCNIVVNIREFLYVNLIINGRAITYYAQSFDDLYDFIARKITHV